MSLLFGLLHEVPHLLLIYHNLLFKETSEVAHLILLQSTYLCRQLHILLLQLVLLRLHVVNEVNNLVQNISLHQRLLETVVLLYSTDLVVLRLGFLFGDLYFNVLDYLFSLDFCRFIGCFDVFSGVAGRLGILSKSEVPTGGKYLVFLIQKRPVSLKGLGLVLLLFFLLSPLPMVHHLKHLVQFALNVLCFLFELFVILLINVLVFVIVFAEYHGVDHSISTHFFVASLESLINRLLKTVSSSA